MRPYLPEWHSTKLWRSVAAACADHAVAAAAAAAPVLVARRLGVPAGVAIAPLALLAAARAQRALECLGHEASHYNWTRTHRAWNDALSELLVVVPVFERIANYRTSHLVHHGRFATAEDPDCQRYAELDLEGLDRSSLGAFCHGIAVRLPRYARGWWTAVGTNALTVARSLLWHGTAVAIASAVAGPAVAVPAWLLWQAAFVVVLPVLRLAGEADEHVYSEAGNVFDATVSNLGTWQRFLLHPHNDGYHTVHHLWPGIPHHRLRRAHEVLMEIDPAGYGLRLRRRDRILSAPTPIATPPRGLTPAA